MATNIAGTIGIYHNGMYKSYMPYKYDATAKAWKPVTAYLYKDATWNLVSSGLTEEPNAYGTTAIIARHTTENNSYGTTAVVG